MMKFIRRVLFWTYERGSWQYDLIVIAILAFIFLTPSALFDGSLFRRTPTPQPPSEPIHFPAKPEGAQSDASPPPAQPEKKRPPAGEG